MTGKLLLLLACMVAAAPSQAKEPLIWLLADWPPFIEMNGDELVGGVTGQQMKMLFARLPEFDHSTRGVSLTRMEVELGSSQPVCTMPLQRVKRREGWMLFSKPMHLGLGNRLFVRQSTFEQLGRPDIVNIETILTHPQLSGMVFRSRSYSDTIDQALLQTAGRGNYQTSVLPTDNALKMLVNSRIDYLLEYPSVVRHWEKRQQHTVPLVSVRIAGNTDFTLGYLACANTDWGKTVMPKINEALTELIDDPAYQALLYSSLNAEEQQAFRVFWQQHLQATQARSKKR